MNNGGWRPPAPPSLRQGFGGATADIDEPLKIVVRTSPAGPPLPHPGEKAPHQDLGELASGFAGDIQGVGEVVSYVLDQPLHQTIGIDGPHRMIDNVSDIYLGLVRGLIHKTLERGDRQGASR